MRAFTYHRPASLDDAVASLEIPDTYALGGGTDLLTCVEDGIATPAAVVDLRAIAELDEITVLPDGGLRIGAAARVSDIAAHEIVRARFPVLADACAAVGTPALRNMGTLGGNLCQRPRCWYFRRAISCFKNGGSSCPARDGENQYHAIVDGGPCYIVHPSDPAVALTALDAEIEIAGPTGTSRIPITRFFVLPRDRMDSETVLRPGEVVSAVTISDAFDVKPSNRQTGIPEAHAARRLGLCPREHRRHETGGRRRSHRSRRRGSASVARLRVCRGGCGIRRPGRGLDHRPRGSGAVRR